MFLGIAVGQIQALTSAQHCETIAHCFCSPPETYTAAGQPAGHTHVLRTRFASDLCRTISGLYETWTRTRFLGFQMYCGCAFVFADCAVKMARRPCVVVSDPFESPAVEVEDHLVAAVLCSVDESISSISTSMCVHSRVYARACLAGNCWESSHVQRSLGRSGCHRALSCSFWNYRLIRQLVILYT